MRLSLVLLLATAPVWAGDRNAPAATPRLPEIPVALPSSVIGLPQVSQPLLEPGLRDSASPAALFIANTDLKHAGAQNRIDAEDLFISDKSELLSPERAEELAARFDGTRPLRIAMAASESVPFIKTGGLADVVDSLTRGLAARGHDVTLFLPNSPGLKFGDVPMREMLNAPRVSFDNKHRTPRVQVGSYKGVRVIVIDGAGKFFLPNEKKPDIHTTYGAYGALDESYVFFSKAVLATAEAMKLDVDNFVVHDWHAALIPALIKMGLTSVQAKTTQVLHNLAFQGNFPPITAVKAGISSEDLTIEKFGHYGELGLIKSGIQHSDDVVTVSPNYAREIREDARMGMGMEGALRFRAENVHGIINGIDRELWSPADSKVIAKNFDSDTAEEGKAVNKAFLQKKAGLPVEPAAPLFGVVSRITDQKGIDLVASLVPFLVEKGAQLVITGTGDAALVAQLKELQARFPQHLYFHSQFSEEFARWIYAAEDIFLMPSIFEPCGLSQMMAHMNGALVVATPVGGLVDTVNDLRVHQNGDGFFAGGLTAHDLQLAVEAALERFADKLKFAADRVRAMKKDYSWDRSIDKYEALLYKQLGLKTPKQ